MTTLLLLVLIGLIFVCVRLTHGCWWISPAEAMSGLRPHRVDNPVGGRASRPALPPAWGTHAAALERVPASVRDEFTLPDDRVDRRTFAGGVLLVPDDGDVDQSAAVPLVIRTSRPQDVHVSPVIARWGAARLQTGLAREAARIRRETYQQLLRDRAAERTEPTVGPLGPSRCSSCGGDARGQAGVDHCLWLD